MTSDLSNKFITNLLVQRLIEGFRLKQSLKVGIINEDAAMESRMGKIKHGRTLELNLKDSLNCNRTSHHSLNTCCV